MGIYEIIVEQIKEQALSKVSDISLGQIRAFAPKYSYKLLSQNQEIHPPKQPSIDPK